MPRGPTTLLPSLVAGPVPAAFGDLAPAFRDHCQNLWVETNMALIQRVHISFRYIVRDEDGVTAIEYAMIAALVAVGLAVSLTGLQGAISTVLTSVGSAF